MKTDLQFDPLYEKERLTFILNRDGLDEAINFAKGLVKTYLKASLTSRVKFKTRNYPFRRSYIHSAYSARYILRNNLIETFV